jgi:hypothetical protein
MSEVLLRGWNVAVPVVDVGDDVLLIDDNDKTTFRLQVKSTRMTYGEPVTAKFTLSRQQLRTPQEIELLYMLMMRDAAGWRFLVLPRTRLAAFHRDYVHTPRMGPGRRPKADDAAKTDALTLDVRLTSTGPMAWGVSLGEFGCWPEMLPEIDSGPGSVRT